LFGIVAALLTHLSAFSQGVEAESAASWIKNFKNFRDEGQK
jgi:hypothetical protein